MSTPTSNGTRSIVQYFFVRNTFARLALIALSVGGFVAYSGMIKETNPDLAIGVGMIQTEWAGGDPQTIEQEITLKIEKQLKSLKGVKRIQSGSYAGYSLIVVEFRPNVPQRDAMARLRAKVSEAEGELPKGARKPAISPASINDMPIFSFRLHGVDDLASVGLVARDLRRELERVPGVNKAVIFGDREEVIQVRLIGARMAAYGVTSDAVRQAIASANVDMPWGDFDGEEVGAGFRFLARFRDIKDLQKLPITKSPSGRTVLLGELAVVKRGYEMEYARTYFADLTQDSPKQQYQAAIDITITKRPGADAVETIAAIKELLERETAKASWPPALRYTTVYDESTFINADLRSIFNNGWQAMLAVFVILLISLTWREALVAGLAIPVAFGTGLVIVAAIGYTLNSIVIVGMVLALGLLVDDFILMMEGMHENIFVKGKSFAESALATVKTFAIPSLSGSLTTILAMAPLLFIAGVEGKFIRQMPITTIACLAASYLISIFLVVPLSGYLLHRRTGGEVRKTMMDRMTEKASSALAGLLKRVFVRNRFYASMWIAVALAIFAYSYTLFSTRPIEMMPKGDGRTMGITIELSPDASLESAQRCADIVGKIFLEKPYLANVTKHVGEKSPFSTVSTTDQLSPTVGNYLVGFSLSFVPKKQRDQMVFEYVPELRAEIEAAMIDIPGGVLTMTPDLGGASAEAPIRIELLGTDMNVLREMALSVEAELNALPGTSDVRNNFGTPKLDVRCTPDREAMHFYGFDANTVAQQVRSMMVSDETGKFIAGDFKEDLKIRMGYAWPSRNGELGGPMDFAEIYLLNLISHDGRRVPLSSVTDFRLEESALTILHKNGERAISVMAQTNNRTAAEIIADLQPKLDAMAADWPPGYRYQIAGEAESSEEVFGSSGKMLVLALFLVFALLVLQFDNFKQPFIIMSAIPLALTGTFLGFYLLQMSFSFMAMVGIIALVGIVVNDTIIMIETMNNYYRAGTPLVEATARGTADRLRPIVTTSVTTIVGLIPLAISQKVYLPLSVTVVAGLIFSTFLALLIVPCLYLILTPNRKQEVTSPTANE